MYRTYVIHIDSHITFNNHIYNHMFGSLQYLTYTKSFYKIKHTNIYHTFSLSEMYDVIKYHIYVGAIQKKRSVK